MRPDLPRASPPTGTGVSGFNLGSCQDPIIQCAQEFCTSLFWYHVNYTHRMDLTSLLFLLHRDEEGLEVLKEQWELPLQDGRSLP